MIQLLLAVQISFTAPQYDASLLNYCDPDAIPVPCSDLDSVRVYGTRRSTTGEQLLLSIPASGKEGQAITASVTLPDHPTDIWTLWVRSLDKSGNLSCYSNMISINTPASVPLGPPAEEKEEWFDVAGRRLTKKPSTPGVYFRRRGLLHNVVVIYH